jgi:alpha-galactosidase
MQAFFLFTALVAASALAIAAEPPPPQGAVAPAQPAFWSWASRPVMGWNSWDCYGAGVNEEQTLANARYMKDHLLVHGYNLITVDIQWYEPRAHGPNYRRNAALEMDANGRLLPAANRFPSSKETRSFKPLADQIHALGLKFGVHLLRGIPRQAVANDAPILGTEKLRPGGVHAAEIADKKDICFWNTDMYGVDMSKPGAQEYYDSVLALLATWEVDFLKVDDLSAPRYHTAEVEAIRKAIDRAGRPIVLSTSPGDTPVAEGKHVEMHANQWRISNDFWDQWPLLREQFARLDAWTPYRGAGHFPDADMLPVGNIRVFQPSDAWTHFTHDEQVTMMTLWSIARSPLILGGNLPANDAFTLNLLTNDEVLRVDQHSTHNRQLWKKGDLYAWAAEDDEAPAVYAAVFNAPDGRRRGRGAPPPPQTAAAVSLDVADLLPAGAVSGQSFRELWGHKEIQFGDKKVISASLLPHQAALYKIEYRKP